MNVAMKVISMGNPIMATPTAIGSQARRSASTAVSLRVVASHGHAVTIAVSGERRHADEELALLLPAFAAVH